MAFLGIYFGENGIKKLELQFLYLFIDHVFLFKDILGLEKNVDDA